MPRNKGWFRLYNRMIDSPQVLELNDSEFRLLISIWCLVSESDQGGKLPYSAQALRRRVMPDKSLEEIQQMLEHLIQLDLLSGEDGHYEVPRWEIHQYEYNSRIPKNRTDLNKRKDNGKSTESERKENGKIDTEAEAEADTETETDTDTEKDLEEGPAAPSLPPNLSQVERQALKELKAVPGYPFDLEKDPELLRSLMIDFPTIDPVDEIKKWRAYKLDHPLTKKSNPRLQLRRWFENAQRWSKDERASPDEEKYADIYLT